MVGADRKAGGSPETLFPIYDNVKGTMKKIDGRMNESYQNLLNESDIAHYRWCRLVVTLAVGVLTLSVSLHGAYVVVGAAYMFLLKSAWLSLFLSILFGLLGLYGEIQTPLDILNSVQSDENPPNDTNEQSPRYLNVTLYRRRAVFRYSSTMLVMFFLIALVLMSIFAGLNLS